MEPIPVVSIVMCCYNAEAFIYETIQSVLKQTFEDFEFIIWNDGSTDKTEEIIREFSDSRIKYFFHHNTGVGRAAYLACREARGKYIARIDSDDLCFPDRIEKEVAFLENHPDHVLVSSAVLNIDETGKHIGQTFPCTNDKILKKSILFGNMIAQPMVLFRKDAYLQTGGYSGLRTAEDLLLWGRMAKLGKFHNISEPLGCYRLLSNSLDHEHERSPYHEVLMSLVYKMIKDDTILESDVDLYNTVYAYGKRANKERNHVLPPLKRKTFEEHLFGLISCIVGKNIGQRIIAALKNIYYHIKLRC